MPRLRYPLTEKGGEKEWYYGNVDKERNGPVGYTDMRDLYKVTPPFKYPNLRTCSIKTLIRIVDTTTTTTPPKLAFLVHEIKFRKAFLHIPLPPFTCLAEI